MKPKTKAQLTFLVLLFFFGNLISQSSFTEMMESGIVMNNDNTPIPSNQALVVPTEGVDFYMDEAMFNAGCTVEISSFNEDFVSSVATIANGVFNCGNTISNSEVTNACFVMGELIPGFQMTLSNPMNSIVLLTPSSAGTTLNSVGANSFADNTIIDFTQPYNSVSLRAGIYSGGDGTLTYEVYAASGLLGSTTINVGAAPTFTGMIASEPITQIVLIAPSSGGELVSELTFGNCANAGAGVPTLSQWGLMILGLLFLIIGIATLKQKKLSVKAV